MNKRQKELAQASLDAEKAVLRDLERQYRRALDDVDEKVKAFAVDIERLEQAIEQEADDAQKEILISRRRSKVYQKQYQEALQGQLDGILEKMHGDNYQTIEQYLKDCYEDAYIGTLYELQGQGVPLIMPIDQAAAVKAIQLDTKLSKPLYTALGVDINGLKTTIQREITRGIASGMTWQEMARNIHNQSTAPKNRAKLIARTEGHRIQSSGHYDAQKDAKKRGADVLKQWSAALDSRTRGTHVRLDGQICEVEDFFEIDGKKARFPGDFGRPEEDCNCRCRSNTRARWALESAQTKMLGNTDDMTDRQLAPIAEKLHISVDELRKYSGQIIPVKAKDFEDFKRQYNQIWNDQNRENFVAPVSVEKRKGLAAKIGGGDVPQHEAPKLVKQVDFKDRVAVMREITRFEQEAAKSSIELARVVTKAGQVYDCFGVKDRVFPDFDLQDSLKGAIISHSHPNGETQYTFSHDDLDLFLELDLETLRGCDEKYTYEFNRNADDIDDIDDPDIGIDDLLMETFAHYDMINRAKKNGIGYRRWKR